MNKTKSTDDEAQQLSRVLEALPSADQFMKRVHLEIQSKDEQRFIVPYLKELHNVVHELLPKPNKGLWEPDLNLDPLLLSYFALFYQNEESVDQQRPVNDQSEDNDDSSSVSSSLKSHRSSRSSGGSSSDSKNEEPSDNFIRSRL